MLDIISVIVKGVVIGVLFFSWVIVMACM